MKMDIRLSEMSTRDFLEFSFLQKRRTIRMAWNMTRFMLRSWRYLKQLVKLNIKQKDMETGMHLRGVSLQLLDQCDSLVNLTMRCMWLKDLRSLNGGQGYCLLTGERKPCAMQCGELSLQIIEFTYTENVLGMEEISHTGLQKSV